jgi:hypothetical protein
MTFIVKILIAYIIIDYVLTILEKFSNNSKLVETYRGRNIYINELDRFEKNEVIFTVDKPYCLNKNYPDSYYLSIHDKTLQDARKRIDKAIIKKIEREILTITTKLRIT